MIGRINYWELKGFRICIIPQQFNKQWLWTAGVYIDNETKANWVDSQNGLPKAAYQTYADAFAAADDFCNNYKNKKK